MTDATIDWTEVGRLPALVVDHADLDLVELCLAGVLPARIDVAEALPGDPTSFVIHDSQNTPVALADKGPDGTLTLRALRPLAHEPGPQGDPAVRVPGGEVRDHVADSSTIAIAFDDLPSLADLDDVRRIVGDAAPQHVLWCVLVGRTTGDDTYAPSLTRATLALAEGYETSAHVVPLAVPWTRTSHENLERLAWAGDTPLSLDTVLAGYGATMVVAQQDLADSERDTAQQLTSAWEQAAASLYPEPCVTELRREIPHTPRTGTHRGAIVMFTGLSGSGKSTLARAFAEAVHTEYEQTVSLLDGDEFRQLMSYGLGFDRESRDLNVRRIGFASALVAKHGGIAVAAPIAPFAAARAEVRKLAEEQGVFLLVHMATPLAVCERRDSKGMYARARAGLVTEFTGISSPYEDPDDADVVIDSSTMSVDASVELLLAEFRRRFAP